MLQAYGMVPSEFGELSADERLFIQLAWVEEQERKQDEYEDLERQY